MTFAPRTWVVGEVVTAAYLNAEIRDQINSMLAAWTSYTPAWTAVTTNPTIGNGAIGGRYMLIGRTCHFALEVSMGSTTAFGSGAYSLSLPFASAAGVGRIATGQAVNSTGRGDLTCVIASGNSVVNPFAPGASSSITNQLTSSGMFGGAWANGSLIRINGTYETN
ncbi:hypothetical protein ABZ883_26480 [Streptomyces sp. NPDC046977]|uniref:hypothetical protein n=1 Tax=Streptomyces sp. NPDC046977 TaxID=3154703 RepID=UPI00340AC86B